ncbi:MAG: sugar transferase [Planctomycetaceae bacterium]|nr:sugar transferase [Planctomycetaceae bacterium]
MTSIQNVGQGITSTPTDIGENCSQDAMGRAIKPVTVKRAWYLPVKSCLDWCGALILLILTAPFTLLGIILIKVTSPGPAFYLQTRLGQNDTPYKVIKLRTMIHNAEAKTGAVWSQAGDPRVTKIGRILRKTHIDEFPQLINVLLGQMSLVGPRPERPEIAFKLAWELKHYEDRTLVKPGITGLAQLRLPPDSDIEGVRRKLACDLFYVQEVSPWLDLRIFIFTGWLFAEVFLKAAWRRIYVPDARCITESVDHYFPEGIDLKPRSES